MLIFPVESNNEEISTSLEDPFAAVFVALMAQWFELVIKYLRNVESSTRHPRPVAEQGRGGVELGGQRNYSLREKIFPEKIGTPPYF
jgi:hypothetical protein